MVISFLSGSDSQVLAILVVGSLRSWLSVAPSLCPAGTSFYFFVSLKLQLAPPPSALYSAQVFLSGLMDQGARWFSRGRSDLAAAALGTGDLDDRAPSVSISSSAVAPRP